MESDRQEITQNFMLEVSRSTNFRSAIAKIIQRDHLTILFDLVEAIWRNDEDLVKNILSNLGSLDHVFNSWLIMRATYNGNINLVTLLCNAEIIRDAKLLVNLINTTMRHQHTDLLEWYLSNIPSYCMDTIFLNCEIVPIILSHDGEIFEILLRHGYPSNEIRQIVELFDIDKNEFLTKLHKN